MPRHLTMVTLLGAALLGGAGEAGAQLCAGANDFAARAPQLELGAGVPEGGGAVFYSTNVAVGARSGAYGGIGVGMTAHDGTSRRTWIGSANAGYRIAPAASSRTQLCPIVAASFGFGPDGADFRSRHQAFTAGLSVGHAIGPASGVRLVPTVTAGLGYMRWSYRYSGDRVSGDRTHGGVSVGAGLLLGSSLALVPSVGIPIGDDGGGMRSYNLRIAYNLRR